MRHPRRPTVRLLSVPVPPHLRRKEVVLPPVPPLRDTYIIPAGVREVYTEIVAHFDSVQVGRDDHWVLGADTAQGGLRIFFSRKGVMESLHAVHHGRDITRAVHGDVAKAVSMLNAR